MKHAVRASRARRLRATWRPTVFLVSLLIPLTFACSKDEQKELSAEEKQERVEALLKASGAEVAPKSKEDTKLDDVPPTSEAGDKPKDAPLDDAGRPMSPPPSAHSDAPAQPSNAAQPRSAAPVTGQTNSAPLEGRTQVRVIDAGGSPKRALRYNFQQGQQRKFSMDLEIAPTRLVNGQATPGMPPMALSVTGTTQTERTTPALAERSYTFLDIVPSVAAIPPEIAEQMKAQFKQLSGLQLIEQVTPLGQVQNLSLKDSAMNPQILALLQYLTDGMTNAFLPLPEEPIGKGAKWIATTHVESAGLRVTQENTIEVQSLQGDVLTVTLKYVQSAPPQQVESPSLPPGVKVEVVKLDGSGNGKMTADLHHFTVDSKIEVSMQVDTKITEPGAPQPLTESGLTKMRAQIRVTR